jgi:hypothetical protein
VGREADAVYVNLTDRAIKDSAEVADEGPTALTQFNLDLPKAG